jgi:short-subunit dehydrogenase
MKISGARVLVTGGNRGIGLALAEAFKSAGAEVTVGVRDPSLVKGFKALELDLSSRGSIESALPNILKCEFDILVNNAGLLTGGLLEDQPLDEIYAMYQVNLVGLTHLTRAVLPGMVARGRGKIINNSSVSGVMNFPMASTYSAAKTGVIALSACLNAELSGTGVSALVMVTPGVKTRMFDEIPKKYGAKMDLALLEGAIRPEDWAAKVIEAVHDDRDVLLPSGSTRVGLLLARFTPKAFNAFVGTKFHRSGG